MREAYNKGYKYRLLPNKEQKVLLGKTFGCSRFLWNRILADEKKSYQESGKGIFLTPASFKSQYEWLKEIDSLALANTFLYLHKAFRTFFKGISRYPKFKSKKATKQSYTTNNQEASNAIRIENGKIRLPKLGWIRFVEHRNIADHEKIKTCTITKTASGKYTISIIVEGIRCREQIHISKEKTIGLDYSMTHLYVSSSGEKANHQHCYRQAQQQLRKLSREVSRKTKGGKNRHKARIKLAQEHEHVANLRSDYLHNSD